MSRKAVVAVLDWGLGHATRCVPVIKALQQKGFEVLVASSGSALALLRKEFPALTFFEIASYNIRYSTNIPFAWNILLQLPRIRKSVSTEHDQLERIIRENKIDLVISDNRYGCWSRKIPSVFIGHQLKIQLPVALRLIKPVVDRIHHKMIRNFMQCWVPDIPGKLKLSGTLSETRNLPVKYIGILSRFEKTGSLSKYDLAVVLSGPEPQRSILEDLIMKQLLKQSLNAVVVRGVIEDQTEWRQEGSVSIVNYLQGKELAEVITQSQLVIARPGYSTMMDLAVLCAKAIFVPTPGQTEQEYLGKKMMEDKIAFCTSQRDFNLTEALRLSSEYKGFSHYPPNELLSRAIDELVC